MTVSEETMLPSGVGELARDQPRMKTVSAMATAAQKNVIKSMKFGPAAKSKSSTRASALLTETPLRVPSAPGGATVT